MKWTTIISGCAALLVLAGCGPSEDEPTIAPETNAPPMSGQIPEHDSSVTTANPSDRLPPASESGVEASASATVNSREGFIEAAQTQLQTLSADIERLGQKAAGYTGEVKVEAEQMVEALKKQAQAAQTELDQLRDVSGEAWKELKTGIEEALAKLEKAYKQVDSGMT